MSIVVEIGPKRTIKSNLYFWIVQLIGEWIGERNIWVDGSEKHIWRKYLRNQKSKVNYAVRRAHCFLWNKQIQNPLKGSVSNFWRNQAVR
jgi:hypothetical protein